jgi:hypothetical protein
MRAVKEKVDSTERPGDEYRLCGVRFKGPRAMSPAMEAGAVRIRFDSRCHVSYSWRIAIAGWRRC